MKESLNPYSNGIYSMSLRSLRTNNPQVVVLILILMEYALWARGNPRHQYKKQSLNPYSNGICSLREYLLSNPHIELSLNPYSNGICSLRSEKCRRIRKPRAVLILILMEYTLWGIYKHSSPSIIEQCLNPYSNGIYSMRASGYAFAGRSDVLILILMEYTLWGIVFT